MAGGAGFFGAIGKGIKDFGQAINANSAIKNVAQGRADEMTQFAQGRMTRAAAGGVDKQLARESGVSMGKIRKETEKIVGQSPVGETAEEAAQIAKDSEVMGFKTAYGKQADDFARAAETGGLGGAMELISSRGAARNIGNFAKEYYTGEGLGKGIARGAATLGVLSVGGRVVSGGGWNTKANGEKDIVGIPFV